MLYPWHSSSFVFIFFVSTFCEFNVLDCKEGENRTEKQNIEENKEHFWAPQCRICFYREDTMTPI